MLSIKKNLLKFRHKCNYEDDKDYVEYYFDLDCVPIMELHVSEKGYTIIMTGNNRYFDFFPPEGRNDAEIEIITKHLKRNKMPWKPLK
jgi:hypothetical protein